MKDRLDLIGECRHLVGLMSEPQLRSAEGFMQFLLFSEAQKANGKEVSDVLYNMISDMTLRQRCLLFLYTEEMLNIRKETKEV